MKREILFRGKRKDNGEWVEGCYVYDNNLNHHIRAFDNCYYAVIPETVCEWTGLTDKNGKQIFEGDIIQFKCELDGELQTEELTIFWDNEIASFLGESNQSDLPTTLDFMNECKVIGDKFNTRKEDL